MRTKSNIASLNHANRSILIRPVIQEITIVDEHINHRREIKAA
jgi:hypothetical protein